MYNYVIIYYEKEMIVITCIFSHIWNKKENIYIWKSEIKSPGKKIKIFFC